MTDLSFAQYRIMAQAFTALSVARPVTIVPPEAPLDCAECTPEGYPVDWCWLVADDQQAYGYLPQETIDEAGSACTRAIDIVKPFGRQAVIPGSMPLTDLIRRLAKQDDWILYVLTDGGITHVVTGEEYDSTPVKLCLFALVLELEQEMTHVLRSQPERLEQRLAHLSPRRQERLAESCARAADSRYPRWRRADAQSLLG